LKIGITGNNGFIGYHLLNSITYFKEDWSVIPFSKNIFQSKEDLCSWIRECDVIVHLAGVNRADSDKEVYEANIKLNEALKEAIEISDFTGHLVFTSSAQENSETLYGKAKKESRIFLKDAVAKRGGKFTGLIIPNVFGPFCKPNYNSFIATFCSKILNKEAPTVINDAEVPLVYVGQLVDQIINIISKGTQNESLKISKDIDINVSKVLSLLETFNSSYIENNTIPKFNSQFELQLFNTFRSYLKLDNRYPVLLEKHTDSRGFFSEIIRTDNKRESFPYQKN
jgi:UDP-2-acetamido-2,6-beta-L-arabino-hexul-4-ose reductase